MKCLLIEEDYIDGRIYRSEAIERFNERREKIKNFLQEEQGSFLIVASPGLAVLHIIESLLPNETGNICLYSDYHKPDFTMDTPDDCSIYVDYEAACGDIDLCENLAEELEKMGWEKIVIFCRKV